MAFSAPKKSCTAVWISEGMILTAANLLVAAGNYLFQAIMRRHLSWSEFGYLNATLNLITFTSVPLTAASQALTHHLARIRASENPEEVAQLQAASLKLLRHLTWVLFTLSAILLPPVSEYLHFPRLSLAWAGLIWLPVNLWSTLGTSWCTGLSRFHLLAWLMMLGTLVRLATGTVAVSFYPWAEAGISASIFAGLIMASIAVFSPHHATVASLRRFFLQRAWIEYAVASLAVAFSSFVLLQGDQIIAQRYFPGEELGRYSGAGLLGRTIVWASLPILTIYFTRRSGHHLGNSSPTRLLAVYFTMIGVIAAAVFLLRVPLLQMLLGVHDAELSALTASFVVSMIPIAILQAMGCHYLAARRFPECHVFGACGIAYLVSLAYFGQTPLQMLHTMGLSALASIVMMGLVSLLRRSKNSPCLSP